MQFGVDESVAHWAAYRPQSIAVYSNGQTYNYHQLDEHSSRLAARLDRLCRGRERVGIAVDSRVGFLVALIGVIRSGRSVVLLNTGLVDDAIRTNLRDANVRVLIHDSVNSRLLRLISGERRSILVKKAFAKGTVKRSVQKTKKARLPEDEWGVLFSSGTTGVPKGIERDHYSMVTEHLGWCIELGLNRHSVFYVGRPIFYTGGLVLTLSTLLCGGAVVLNDYANHNDPDEVWEDYQRLLKSVKVSWAFFVPDQIRSFVMNARTQKKLALSCQSILTMGAPISGDEKVNATQRLHSNIIESWGNSESLGTITDPDDLRTRPHSIGRPFLTDELFVVDDKLRLCKPGQLGRIAGGAEAGFLRYSNRPRETNRVRKRNLIVSEDVGYVDEQGYFYVVGRVQDMVLRGSKTIFLSSIESKWRRAFPGKRIHVVALSKEKAGVDLFAVADRNAVRFFSNTLPRLNRVLRPEERVNQLLVVDKIPTLPSGKIDRVQLRALASGLLNG